MPRYTYSGPPSGVTLADGREVLLYSGKSYELPESEYVQALLERQHLTPVTTPKPDPKPKATKEQTKP